MSQKRTFTRKFKLAAVKKVVEQGLTFREVAKDLGISDSAIRAWKREFHFHHYGAEMGTFYFSCFFGLPRGLVDAIRPRLSAVCEVHFFVPKGVPRRIQ